MASNNVERKKAARRQPPNATVSLKKGKLNTPSAILFLKRKTAALIFYFKTAVWH